MPRPVDYRRRGQAVWLDSISDRMIQDGRLAAWIAAGTIYGVTSNPSIFGQAIERNEGDYNDRLASLARQGKDAFAIYDELTRRDIAAGADLFRAQHEANPADGWISLEVLPSLARDTEGTVAEAKRLHGLLGRPNVLIKVPATAEGIPAVRRLIAAGISVNVTLMFNRRHYQDVAWAYVEGLEERLATRGDLAGLTDLSSVQSVASFFVSRVDTLVDGLLEKKGRKDGTLALAGKAGLANCRVVYQDFLAIFGSDRFKALAARGARVQRPLWASTGTKNPAYSDLLYVEDLVGPDTVNTMPEKTLAALLDHGRDLGDAVLEGADEAQDHLDALRSHGIDVEALGETLQDDGVALFAKSYDQLLSTIDSRREAVAG